MKNVKDTLLKSGDAEGFGADLISSLWMSIVHFITPQVTEETIFSTSGKGKRSDPVLLSKSLAASMDATELMEDSDKVRYVDMIKEIAEEYNETREYDLYQLNGLIKSIQELTKHVDSSFDAVESVVALDINNVVRSTIERELRSYEVGSDEDNKKLAAGDITYNEYANKYDLSEQLDNSVNSDTVIKNLLDMFSPDSIDKVNYQAASDLYREGGMTSEEFKSLVSELEGIDSSDIDRLAEVLEEIKNNTDPDNNKLAHADQLRAESRKDSEIEALEGIQEALEASQSSESSKSFIDGILNASDEEVLGANVVDSLYDSYYGTETGPDGKTRKDRSRSSRNNRSRAPRSGKTSGLKSMASKGLSGAASLGTGLLNGSSGLIKAAPVIGAAASIGLGAYDYYNSEDSSDRIDAVSTGTGGAAGAAAGAAIGSMIFPGVGTIVGGVVGGVAGSMSGGWLGDLMKDPEDYIPDSVKEMGAESEVEYINSQLYPDMVRSIASGESKFDEDDVKDLMKYREKLISKIVNEKVSKSTSSSTDKSSSNSSPDTRPTSTELSMKDSIMDPSVDDTESLKPAGFGVLSDPYSTVDYSDDAPSDSRVEDLYRQGAEPSMIALATGKSVSEVVRITKSDDYVLSESDKRTALSSSSNSSSTVTQQAPVVVQVPVPTKSVDPHKLTDNSISIASILNG